MQLMQKKKIAVIIATVSLVSAFAGIPVALASSATSANTVSTSSSNCQPELAQEQAIASQVAASAQSTIQAMSPQPANLSTSSCFSNILNMGQSIGISFFNPANLVKQLEQMACSAAQQALQWPESQLQGAIGTVNNSTGGLVTVTGGSNGGSVSSSTVTTQLGGAASGPSIPSINTGNSTLNNILG